MYMKKSCLWPPPRTAHIERAQKEIEWPSLSVWNQNTHEEEQMTMFRLANLVTFFYWLHIRFVFFLNVFSWFVPWLVCMLFSCLFSHSWVFHLHKVILIKLTFTEPLQNRNNTVCGSPISHQFCFLLAN